MDTLSRYRGKKTRYPDSVMSVELEVEFKRPPVDEYVDYDWLNSHYIMKDDGSLRNVGREFVSLYPTNLQDTLSHIETLISKINKDTVADLDAVRTGYHVHCNVQHKTMLEILTSIAAYWMVESCVSSMCGRLREGSLYCVRAVDGKYQVDELIKAIERKRLWLGQFTRDRSKYSGLNLFTLQQFGTLEHRMMRGFLDAQKLQTWTQFCYDITYNHGYKSPAEVLDTFYSMRDKPYEFLERTIKTKEMVEHLKAHLTEAELKDRLLKSALTILKFAYKYRDTARWEVYEKDVVKGFGDKPQFNFNEVRLR